MSFIYDNESMADLWLVTVGIRIRSWDFTVTFTHRRERPEYEPFIEPWGEM